jgi:hypothetical protein
MTDMLNKTKGVSASPIFLPLEIHRAILDQVDSKRDLCAVARVSRLMQMGAECLMYREVEFGDDIDSIRRIVLALKHICASVALPLYIQRFALYLHSTKSWEYHDHLVLALQRMTRLLLRSLSVRCHDIPRQVNIFYNCAFKLSVLDIESLDYVPLRFLEFQPPNSVFKIGGLGSSSGVRWIISVSFLTESGSPRRERKRNPACSRATSNLYAHLSL